MQLYLTSGSNTTTIQFVVIATDNVRVDQLSTSIDTGASLALGVHTVVAMANDSSSNIATPCSFNITVSSPVSTPPATPTSSSSTTTIAAVVGAIGGVAAVTVAIAFIIWRRTQKRIKVLRKDFHARVDQQSDEWILARAQAIQQAFKQKKAAARPNLNWLKFPTTQFISPPRDIDQLKAFITDELFLELPLDSVSVGVMLETGDFGDVHQAKLNELDGKSTAITVKILKDAKFPRQKVRLLREAGVLAQFKHPKISKVLGTVTKDEPMMVCLELMHLGSLESYLRTETAAKNRNDQDLLRMAADVCSAMYYLNESGVIHRDLSAKCIYLNQEFVCKVAEFTLCMRPGGDAERNIELLNHRISPIEAIKDHKFSVGSDVWSFGVLLWEMWSNAAQPYKGWTNTRIMEQLESGYRLPAPKNTPEVVYSLMLDCWNSNAAERPNFRAVFEKLLYTWDVCFQISQGKGDSSVLETAEQRKQRMEAIIAGETEDQEYDIGGAVDEQPNEDGQHDDEQGDDDIDEDERLNRML